MANIKEVARMAGVSAATVSKYLNGIHIKKNNALAIEDAIKVLDYQRDDIARGLRTRKSMTVGVLLPELNNLFFTSIISSVDDTLEAHGYSTIVCDCKSSIEREQRRLSFLLGKRIDGLIAVPCSSASEFVAKLPENCPVVLIDRHTEGMDCDCIMSDNHAASYSAAEILIKAGHRNIGILVGPDEMYTPIERLEGFCAACSDNGISVNSTLIKKGGYDIDSGYKMTCDLLDMKNPPTAIYATNNELTIGAVTALNDRGLIVGHDISFIGFDNTVLASSSNPKITVIVQPTAEIGYTAATALLKRLKGSSETSVIRLPTKIIFGGSVKSI